MSTARSRSKSRTRKPAVAQEPAPGRIALTVNEVAWLLHCSPNTVWTLVGSGVLESWTLGRKRLISRAVVEQFINSGGTEDVLG
jgi:excisionase family DNA binding protein